MTYLFPHPSSLLYALPRKSQAVRGKFTEREGLALCSRALLFPKKSDFARPAWAWPARQWLPLWGSWRVAPERARPLPKNHKRSDSIAPTKGLLIAARRLSGDGLALSVTFGDTSPKGRGFRIPSAPERATAPHSQTHPPRPSARRRWRWCRGPRGRGRSRRRGWTPPRPRSCP